MFHPDARDQEISTLMFYDFLYYGAEKDDFVLLVSSHFSFVRSDMNEVYRVIFHCRKYEKMIVKN